MELRYLLPIWEHNAAKIRSKGASVLQEADLGLLELVGIAQVCTPHSASPRPSESIIFPSGDLAQR
jgi:hypothetical protein